MIQQINLYQPSSDNENNALTNPYLLLVFTAVFVLVFVSVLSVNRLHSNRDHKIQLQAQIEQGQKHLEQLQTRRPDQQIDTLLNQELQHSQNYYQNLSQILELLADTHSDRSLGFSRYLSALAEQADSNIWLTRIHINSETADISLKGGTFKAEQIPLLLQHLQNTSAFKGRHFAKLSIQQSSQMPEQIEFTVSSSLKSDPEESDVRKH